MALFEEDSRYWLLAIAFVVIVGLVMVLYLRGTTPPDLPPTPPRDINAYQNNSGVIVEWMQSISGDVEGYNLYRSEIPGTLGKKINENIINETSFVDGGVALEGYYYYTLRAVDLNQEGPDSDQASVFYDRTPPKRCLATAENNFIKQTTVRLDIACEDAYDCRFSNDNEIWPSFSAYINSVSWEVTEAEGQKTVYYQCRDKYGNEGGVSEIVFVLDKTPPTIEVDPLRGYYEEGENLTLRFKVKDNTDAAVNCTVDTPDFIQAITLNKGKYYEHEFVNLVNGTFIINLSCMDDAGNTDKKVEVANVIERAE